MTGLTRVEIVANQAVEAEVIEILDRVGYGEAFIRLDPVYGRGRHGRREGSAVWPETNVQFVVYMAPDVVSEFGRLFDALKKQFPTEGIRAWQVDAQSLGDCS